MHEEPYAQAILDMVLDSAGNRPVHRIWLAVGRFSAVVPESLELFFSHLSRGTPAQDAILIFETVPVTLTCKDCGAVMAPAIPPHLPVKPILARCLAEGCACGSRSLSVTGGLGLDLIRMETDTVS